MVHSAVTSGGWDSLKCPDPGCKAVITYEDVRTVAAKADFNRYSFARKLQLKATNICVGMMSLLPKDSSSETQITLNVIARVATVRGAKYMEEVSYIRYLWEIIIYRLNHCQADNPRMACRKCGFVSCFSCTAPWHEGQTWREYHNLVATDPESEDHKRKYCKRCPGAGCGEYTKKTGACHEMSCPNSKSNNTLQFPKILFDANMLSTVRCARNWCWYCKVILDWSSEGYEARAANQHLTTCTAPAVFKVRQNRGRRGITMPAYGGSHYRPGWDRDEGFIGTGEEEDP